MLIVTVIVVLVGWAQALPRTGEMLRRVITIDGDTQNEDSNIFSSVSRVRVDASSDSQKKRNVASTKSFISNVGAGVTKPLREASIARGGSTDTAADTSTADSLSQSQH